MRMSTKGRYGLRLMIELAAEFGRGPVLMALLAERQHISVKYIPVLVGGLKAAGLLRATRGANGGYELARDPASITAYEVVSALEGDLNPMECQSDPACCPHVAACAAREMWCELGIAIKETLSRHTLKSLAERQHEKTFAAASWSI